MTNVAFLEPVELVFLDAGQLTDIARERGLPRAEYIAHTAIEEIAERLATAEAAWSSGEFARLGKIARLLVGMSEQVGMMTLAKVASGVADAAGRGDDIALAAVVARLVRVGDASLSAIWDIGHLRI